MHLKLSSNRVVFVAKGFLKQLNLPMPIKQESIYPFPEIGSRDFCRITTSVPSKGKSAIPPLFNCPAELLFSASDKAKLFAKNLWSTLILMTQLTLYLLFRLELI